MLDLDLDLEADLGIDTVKQGKCLPRSELPTAFRAMRISDYVTSQLWLTSSSLPATGLGHDQMRSSQHPKPPQQQRLRPPRLWSKRPARNFAQFLPAWKPPIGFLDGYRCPSCARR